jgi:hypothetical protein
MVKGTSRGKKKQASRELEEKCWKFRQPLLEQLHSLVDRRIVKTFLDLVMVILMHRNRNNGLLLSELGDHLLGGERGPAGVKRIANLLHSEKWESTFILKYLWKRAKEKVQELIEQKEAAYVIWDESVLEKSESLKAEGLCAGLFQPTYGSSDLCAGLQLVTAIGHRFERRSCAGTLVWVDDAG